MSSFITPNHLTMLTTSYFSEQRQKQNKRNEWANKNKKQKKEENTLSPRLTLRFMVLLLLQKPTFPLIATSFPTFSNLVYNRRT